MAGPTMRAAFYRATGPAEAVIEVGEIPRPEPAAGEVRVAVRASGINPSDTKRRAGWRGAAMSHPLVVPHADGAGVIDAVGAGVPEARLGERVFLYNAGRKSAFGTCAEFTVVPAEQAVPLPADTSFAEGAALGVPAQTAWFAVMADGPVKGTDVLVQGGAGAVGRYAVAFASLAGARVIATAGSRAGAALAREAGAAVVLDRHRDDVVEAVRDLTSGAGVARIVEVDFGANIAADAQMIAENGVIASYSSTSVPEPQLPYYPLAYKGVTVRYVQAYILPQAARAEGLAAITAHLAAGRLGHSPLKTFPLAETAAAHAFAERDTAYHKTVVTID